LLAGRELGRKRLSLGASIADFLGIAAVKGDPGPGDSEIGIFFYRFAPVLIAAFQIEILVVGNAFFIQITRLGRRGGHGKRIGFTLDVVRIQRRGETQSERGNGADSQGNSAHQVLRNRALWGGDYETEGNIAVIDGRGDERRWTAAARRSSDRGT
jgi:hypothetical protein